MYAIAAACGLAVAGWAVARHTLGSQPSWAGGSALALTSRVSTPLGTRGIAVAERGASFMWQIAPSGEASVEQTAGDVFYRVDPGGPFVVNTAAGEVRVTGTCFRVEVQMKKQLLGGVIGAAVATAVVVSVYEGGVVIVDRRTPAKTAAAGESVTLAVPARGSAAPAETIATRVDVGAMTRDQIVARDQAQSARIAQLEAKLAALEAPATSSPVTEFEIHPSKDKLLEWAKTCTVGVDFPPLNGQTWAAVEAGDRYPTSEVPAINEAFSALHKEWTAIVRAAYIEVTGDEAGARSMSPAAMASELADKGAGDEIAAVRAHVAEERAGLRPPPSPGTKLTALETYVRAQSTLGDTAEAALAKRLGPERASAIRGKHWGNYGTWSGCPEAH